MPVTVAVSTQVAIFEPLSASMHVLAGQDVEKPCLLFCSSIGTDSSTVRVGTKMIRGSREDLGGTQEGRQECQDPTKRTHQAKAGTSGYTYATLAHETHGRLGDEANEQISMLADETCSHSSMQRSAFIRNLKTELSVAINQRQCPRVPVMYLARMIRKAFQKGAACPHAEVG